MQIGIVGLPYSGKSTLFNILLVHGSNDDSAKTRMETERGIIAVPDPRLDALAKIYNPKRKINATIEYIKVPGLEAEGHKGTGLPAKFLANVSTVDVILMIIRAFENEFYPHPFSSIDISRDIRYLESEFILHDLSIIENRLGKLEKLIQKTQDEKEKQERLVLQKCHEYLEQERFINELTLNDLENLLLRSYQFLTAKSYLYLINIDENQILESDNIVSQLKKSLRPNVIVLALSAQIEYEISQLAPKEAEDFFKELNITEPATTKLINASYDLLGLHSFFTVNENEVHAWTISKGNTAVKAAGIVHSDMEKGFIRAEVVPSEELINFGSMQACKERGLVRLEGKDYLVNDGDVLTIRFNI